MAHQSRQATTPVSVHRLMGEPAEQGGALTKDPAFDWTQFRLGIYVRARPEDVYTIWTTSQGLCRWFLRSAAFAASSGRPSSRREAAKVPPFETLAARPDAEMCQTGDRYRWEWFYNDGVAGEDWVLDVRPPTKLSFGFGAGMLVEVLLRKQGVWCEVNLRQYDIPNTPRAHRDMHMGCRAGWVFFLTNLKSVVEGGHDLRETERAKTRQLHLVNI
ncbi:MAG: SRPBCC domain-containing protein [Candidatus Zixiibacteriota bacterium]